MQETPRLTLTPSPSPSLALMAADLAHPSAGASILSATSYDMMHTPESIIDGNAGSFWSTTGSYPQEFVLKLGTESDVEGIST